MTFYCSNPGCRQRWENFKSLRIKNVACPACGKPATALKRLNQGAGSVYVIPDFPEHYNHSLGMVIKNRAHHRQIQRERHLQDWEPTNNSPGSQLSLGRTR
jgi:hypothetical protein